MSRWNAICWLVAALLMGVCNPTAHAADPAVDAAAEQAGLEFYEKKIRPLLVTRCYECHGPEQQEAGLRVDHIATILSGGDQGAAIVEGDPEQSLIVQAVRYTDENFQMPPDGKLSDAEIADLTEWVRMGAPGSRDAPAAESGSSRDAFDLNERRKFWAFQPVAPHEPPAVKNSDWPRDAMDQFVLHKLEEANLQPVADADRRTLIRRLSFDLIGLPPTPAEVAEFLADESPDAYAKVVDRLLASPHFGERWGRHWLDLVRFAETRGHEFDYIIPNAYQYRDYVIRALNADVPYDQFAAEHIAGDLLPTPRVHPAGGFNESVLGTGFWHLGEEVHSPVDIRGDETDRMDNKIDVMTKAFLGLTVSCARCHDHKFDAISTKDYYALGGFLLSSSYRQVRFETAAHNEQIANQLETLRGGARGTLLKATADLQRPALARVAEYLLATREVFADETLGNVAVANATGAAVTDEMRAAWQPVVARVAQTYKLDAATLTAWLETVLAARANAHDPLHPWALVAMDRSIATDGTIAAALGPVMEQWKSQLSASATVPEGVNVLLDFSDPARHDWRPDGPVFGAAATRAGDVRYSQDATQPISRVFAEGAARRDPTWDVLQLAATAERDPTPLNWIQAGRTLRSRTFTLSGRPLFYLVRGSGKVFAAVDSHRIVNGPLHGVTLLDIRGDESLRWVGQDLRGYAGHRAHLEFTPKMAADLQPGDSAEFAVLKVVEADVVPPLPVAVNERVLSLLQAGDGTIAALAGAYQALLLDVNERMAADTLLGTADAIATAQIADWMVTHPLLCATSEPAVRQEVATVVTPFMEQQAALVASIRTTSNLAPALWEGSGTDEFVLIRGNHRTPGDTVPRRLLEAIAGADQPPIADGSGRLELARRMMDRSNPFFSRVMVNRIWQHMFGRGIVATVDNFGIMGQEPTHPELLDHLADRFVNDGWSIKRMIRAMALSRTYQMSSRPDPLAVESDPRNLLFHHHPIRRLEGEVIRDAILAVSGRLDTTMFGPSVEVHLTPFMEGRGRPSDGPLDGNGRRSVYLRVRRNFLNSMFLAFDFPTPFSTIGQRSASNVPAQALTLMNSPLVVEESRRWAQRMLAAGTVDDKSRIVALYQTAFARDPSLQELAAAELFLREQAASYQSEAGDVRPWADLCHVLLNVKEFVFIE